jgi:Protein of unknown function (DUF3365)
MAGCEARPEQPDPKDLLAARQAAFAFEGRMRREIIDRIEREEDPVAVYLAYADHVPEWGKEVSDAAKLDFSRTALGVRNPANEPDAWEQRQMELFNFMADAGQDPETFEVGEVLQEGSEKVFRWLRPMVMSEACLVCHGEAIDSRIKLLLGQEYPLDAATGYSEGQLGGAYSVRKVLSVDGKPPPPYEPKPLPPRLPADERQPGDAPLIQPTPTEAPPAEPSPYDLPADPP